MAEADASRLAAEARDEEITKMLEETCWIYSCLICGVGCASPMPMVWGHGKCLCCRSHQTSGEDCCGPMGCCSDLQKCLCCVSHTQYPPNTCILGCCNVFPVGGRPALPMVLEGGSADAMPFFNGTCWLYYCCCEGVGVTSPTDPLLQGASKCCCCRSYQQTADCCGSEGLCFGVSKTLCCVQYQSYPPQITPGVALCGVTLCCQSLHQSAREVRA
mmetsp:Transcript_51417/g.159317  ORF Transcript_51417/g.159317 Transcript_51417/m.159317 type:complete len:216 (-) Transcript_51417:26-673(-)